MIHLTLLQLLGAVPGQREIFEKICCEIIKVEHPNAALSEKIEKIMVLTSTSGISMTESTFTRQKFSETQLASLKGARSGLRTIAFLTSRPTLKVGP